MTTLEIIIHLKHGWRIKSKTWNCFLDAHGMRADEFMLVLQHPEFFILEMPKTKIELLVKNSDGYYTTFALGEKVNRIINYINNMEEK